MGRASKLVGSLIKSDLPFGTVAAVTQAIKDVIIRVTDVS